MRNAVDTAPEPCPISTRRRLHHVGDRLSRCPSGTTDAAQFRVDFADEIASPSAGVRPAATCPKRRTHPGQQLRVAIDPPRSLYQPLPPPS